MWKFLTTLILVLLVIALAACCHLKEQEQFQVTFMKDGQYAVIETDTHIIYCLDAYETRCGMNLSSCTDGYVHVCQRDVRIFDQNEFKKSRGTGM